MLDLDEDAHRRTNTG